ncbi:MAG: hypothetical protein KGH98_00620 [Candidatus Micrarchaeota archaeon]|nr:hypothetical protein [Candidatus Micrarchaeota archaeon]
MEPQQGLKYCPTCERSSNDARFIGEFCEFCVRAKITKRMKDSVEVIACKNCGKIKTPLGFENVSKAAMGDAIAHELGAKGCKVTVERFDDRGADLWMECETEDGPIEFDYPVRLKIRKQMCMQCYRRTSGYYEALVQLRGDMNKCSALVKRLTRYAEGRGAFIAKVEELDNGYDVYVSDKLLAGEFFTFHKLKPKRSFTLYGMKKGKRLYRNIYLLRV